MLNDPRFSHWNFLPSSRCAPFSPTRRHRRRWIGWIQRSRPRLSRRRSPRWVLLALIISLGLGLAGCSLPRVRAEDRLFLPLALDFLDIEILPKQVFEETTVGGLSGLVYDRQADRFYVLSDDRGNQAPARFYTLKLTLGPPDEDTAPSEAIGIQGVEIEQVTTLLAENGQPYATGTLDPEGIALSPRHTLFIASEGSSGSDSGANAPPFIDEFDLASGQWLSRLPIPARYLPDPTADPPTGVQPNLSFESLTLNADGSTGGLEPFRVFAATESALLQDLAPATEAEALPPSPQSITATQATPVRFLHYLVGSDRATVLAEHLYLVEPAPEGAETGLTELVTLDQAGHFLSLERSFGPLVGASAQLFQLAIGGATDISILPRLQGDWTGITPIAKRPLLDGATLGIPLDNLEGMALGPRLPDGNQSLILISDDNFNELQVTQLLLFRLRME